MRLIILKMLLVLFALIESSQFVQAENYATQVMAATFKLFHPTSTSTCFLVHSDANEESVFLITTAHTLERMKGDAATLVLRREVKSGVFERVDVPIQVRRNNQSLWVKHPQQDVAVLQVRRALPVEVATLSFDLIATEKSIVAQNLNVCSQLSLFTYPERFEANRAGFPVARQGIFSSQPTLSATEYPTMVADFTAFSGDSGGPVFVETDQKAPLIVGVVLGQYFHDERIRTKYENNLMKHPLNLGIVLHAHYVRETIDQALSTKKKGR